MIANLSTTAEPSSPADAEIQRLKDEMELVGYVVSHDLLAPLRIINHACGILKEKQDSPGNAEAQAAMQLLESEAERMKTMLQGVQEYLRLETFILKHTPVDANETVAAAREMLDDRIKAAGARVTCALLPTVMGHRARLSRLFLYLIDNAVKFRRDVAPEVHISAQRCSDGMWKFCVEDNGIGISEEHQELAFRLFQRLHPADTYPGCGLGLALAMKTVMSHGGRMWVESAEGKGSRFFFTLPPAN